MSDDRPGRNVYVAFERAKAKETRVGDVKIPSTIRFQETGVFDHEGRTVEFLEWEWDAQLLVEADGVFARFTFDEERWGQGWEFGVMHRAVMARAARSHDVAIEVEDNSEYGEGRVLTWTVRLPPAEMVFDAYEAACAIEQEMFEPIAKVMEVTKAAVEAQLGALEPHEEEDIQTLLRRVDAATERGEKGRSLERLVTALLQTVRGLSLCESNVRTETEEIDISLWNNKDGFWQKEQALILVECKNWSARATKNEVVAFRDKIRNRRGRCSVGILVAWNDVTKDGRKELLRTSHESPLVHVLTGEEIRAAVTNGTIEDVLTAAWKTATFE